METPRRTRKTATDETTLTPAQQLLLSQAVRNEMDRRQSEKRLVQLYHQSRKDWGGSREEREERRRERMSLVEALSKEEDRRRLDFRALAEAVQWDATMPDEEDTGTDEGKVGEAGGGFFSNWFGFKSPAVKSTRRLESVENEEELEEEVSDAEEETDDVDEDDDDVEDEEDSDNEEEYVSSEDEEDDSGEEEEEDFDDESWSMAYREVLLEAMTSARERSTRA